MSDSSVVIKIVVFSIIGGNLKIFLKNNSLIESSHSGELDLDNVAVNAFQSAFRIALGDKHIEQLYTLNRRHKVQVVYFLLLAEDGTNQLADEFREISQTQLSDEKEIIDYAVQRLRWKIEYTNAVYSLLPVEFTLSDLQIAYEAILGRELDKRNFRKKILSLDIIEPTGHMKKMGQARPAEMFRFKKRNLEFVKVL